MESLILLGELLIVRDIWKAWAVQCNNCADFQEWVTNNALDGVEDGMFEESEFQNIMVKWDSNDDGFVGFCDQ
jgi:hypothetical protein